VLIERAKARSTLSFNPAEVGGYFNNLAEVEGKSPTQRVRKLNYSLLLAISALADVERYQ
jgi:hypothetical protein